MCLFASNEYGLIYITPMVTRVTASGRGTASGYGRNLATNRMVRLLGSKQWRRVYAVCYSNTSSLYVWIKSQRVLINI